MPETSWDFAIIELDYEEFKSIPDLRLRETYDYSIGTEIAILGFHFENLNLSIAQGIVASKYPKADVNYIQIDCSVNQGNSGGPLISIETGEVIGIVTRKNTGLSNMFDTVHDSINALLQEAQRKYNSSNIDVHTKNMYAATSNIVSKLVLVTKEIKRSANVGIGYAYQLNEINKHFQS